jgi:GST-like protein
MAREVTTDPRERAMIDLYYWPTPNGWKISIMLEECELPYRMIPVNIGRGEQFAPAFLELSPNNRMPAIVDHEPVGGGAPIGIFESGAILLYLAEKTGRFLPSDLRGRYEVVQWLMWQMGGLGPMAGQNHHFSQYAPEKIPYAIDRYVKETHRLYGVLDHRLADREFIAGAYSIADMAAYPWIVPHEAQGQKLEEFPNVARWFATMKARPAVRRGRELGRELRAPALDDEAKKILFGQTARPRS